jgi:hypothetical protein
MPKISTGRPVPMAKTAGSEIPPLDFMASGMRTPKYNTAL